MNFARPLLIAAWLACFAPLAAGPARAVDPATAPAVQTPEKAQKLSAAVRLKAWSRARLAAEKQRWAEDRQKFAGCIRQLEEQLKTNRMSPHTQVRFLEACMMRRQ